MAHDDGIHPHGLYGIEGIPQALALDDAAGTGSDVHHISPQVLASQLKGRTGSGTWLIEKSHDGLAPEGRHLLDITVNDILHFLGSFQNGLDFISREVGKSQNILASEGHAIFPQSNHSFSVYGTSGRINAAVPSSFLQKEKAFLHPKRHKKAIAFSTQKIQNISFLYQPHRTNFKGHIHFHKKL